MSESDFVLAQGITLAATPIGNPLDASTRLRGALAQASIIAAEDTRRLRSLAARLGVEVSARVVSCHEHNERQRTPWLLEQARAGERILVVSDAGMPTVSDPGYVLLQAAREAGIPVTVIPGPSAPLTALALSGLSTARFSFEGFVPRKDGERRRLFAALASETRTLIFFDSPRRLAQTLRVAAEVFGTDREAAVCRELTKPHEETWRDSLGALAERAADGVLGEIVLVIAPAPAVEADLEVLAEEALALADEGVRLKDAARQVAAAAGARARDVYEAALARKSHAGGR